MEPENLFLPFGLFFETGFSPCCPDHPGTCQESVSSHRFSGDFYIQRGLRPKGVGCSLWKLRGEQEEMGQHETSLQDLSLPRGWQSERNVQRLVPESIQTQWKLREAEA